MTSALGRHILAGDIGGTNAWFGCLERKRDSGLHVHHFAKVVQKHKLLRCAIIFNELF